ncbi:MAG: hypothetical protein ACTTKP_11485 [Catonella sp.]|uniref:hypothetical protein n=1 Tax=Catonella sp. TaxID=2382125 RepID=UPI003F9FE34E
MKKLLAVLIMLVSINILSIPVYAQKPGGSMTGDEGGPVGEIIGGPFYTRTGWLFYLVDRNTGEQVSETAAYSCDTRGIVDRSGNTLAEDRLRLTSRFGKKPIEVTLEKPDWGEPYTNGSPARGRGGDVKKWLLGSDKKTKSGRNVSRAELLILRAFKSADKAKDWYEGKTVLIFEPFFWHRVHSNRRALSKNGKPLWICATSYNLGKYQSGLSKEVPMTEYGGIMINEFTNNVYPRCVRLEVGTKIVGLKLPKNFKVAGKIPNKDMSEKTYGYGIGGVWNKKQDGIINTYDGSHSPGKPEKTSKKKHTTGKSEIIKQYWVKEKDANGKVEYKNIGAETHKDFDRDKTTKNIQITDEIDKPTEKTTKGYKLVGWFTGHDLSDSTKVGNIDNPRPNGELKSRMAEADNEGFRSGKGEDLITLTLDKVKKTEYKGENTLVVVFLREEKTEGIIDTYNHKDSPGDPEDPSNDKTKQGKKKILKQYWDEFSQF